MWTISTWTNIFCLLFKWASPYKNFDFALINTARCRIFRNFRISSQKRLFQQNHFSLLIRGLGVDSWKNAKKSCVTATLTCGIVADLYQVATSPIYSFAEPSDNANISAQQKVFLLKKSCQFAKSSRHTWDKLNFFTWFPFPIPGNTLLQFNFPILPELPFPLECTVGNLIFPHLQLELPEMHPSAFSTVQCSRVATKIFALKF